MHSSSESKIDKTIALHENAFIQHSANHLIRVYPAAWRVDSSNFNPIVSFLVLEISFQMENVISTLKSFMPHF
jgi:hypothetical protein